MKLARHHGRVTFFCHQNADPDSLCSAYALQRLMGSVDASVKTAICCPAGVSAPTRNLVRNLDLQLPDGATVENIGVAALIDTNNLEQVGPAVSKQIVESRCPIVIVDHHHRHPDMEGLVTLPIINPASSSTAEIVARLYRAGRVRMDETAATALLAAIFIETRYFSLANSATFEEAGSLAASGADPRKIQGLITAPATRSERVARLKAAQRLRIDQVDEWLIVGSEVGSYQSSAARGLLSMGADVSFVAGMVKGRIRVNMRSTEKFHHTTNLHLGRDVAIPLGKGLGGSGGGHPTAAGMQVISTTAEKALEACTGRVKNLLLEKSIIQS